MTESLPGDTFQPGDLLNNTYRIEAILGRGGTSEVYRARSEISGRLVALKVLKAELSANDDYLVLLTREEDIRDIRHDAIVRYSENHRTPEGHVYLLMDYIEGPALDNKLKQGPMPIDDLLTICRRVCEGLQVAHAKNIVHRDLSPDNIILRGGDPAQAVIIDFGIAKDTNPGAETIVGNEFAGKYAYAAPEQLSGQTDARSDIYSLGALLLANFRGKKPDVGGNPMEVVQNKSQPLDTSGVPEPLKAIIDKMTDPNPATRAQSVDEVLNMLDGGVVMAAVDDLLDDATVIAATTVKPSAPAESPKQSQPKPVSKEKKSSGGLIAALAVLVIAGAGAGAYFGGFIGGPKLPVADPYLLLAERPVSGSASVSGNAPTEEIEAAISAPIEALQGDINLTLATGEIAETWGQDVVTVLNAIAPADEWKVVVEGNAANVQAVVNDRDLHASIKGTFAGGLPGALQGTANIILGPLLVTPQMVSPVLAQHADCGPLSLPGLPSVGYGLDDTITVTGRLADTVTRTALFDSLRAIAGDRSIKIDTEILNPTLCLIESFLPNAPDSAIDIEFRFGDTLDPNASGRFFVGENPVIDVMVPPSVQDGFLSVSVLDVSGNVFHLLPNLNRTDNSVAGLRGDNTGPLPVRVAYAISEVDSAAKLAFRVDDSTLGKSKIIVLHSDKPLFDGLRPTTESASGYAEALREENANGNSTILSLDSKILVTAKP
ncbi:serine/threonine protein kinase [Actibacterium pelagium]|uniref:Serine/threonine protein kinase n=1 Tax=Actibacterium pelagium TaxID=2029103 RepID=A0A917AK84_9RHOB|nr:serine/threonine protein kinase [Actibacterium pelagium]GGE58733.1 serine/threonine protein kinase [Actibacterium pelagium]